MSDRVRGERPRHTDHFHVLDDYTTGLVEPMRKGVVLHLMCGCGAEDWVMSKAQVTQLIDSLNYTLSKAQ